MLLLGQDGRDVDVLGQQVVPKFLDLYLQVQVVLLQLEDPDGLLPALGTGLLLD